MPTSQGGEVENSPAAGGFSKPPAGTTFMSTDDLKNVAGGAQENLSKAAAALGGKVTQDVSQEDIGPATKVIDLDKEPEAAEDEELVDIEVADRREFLRTLMAGEPYQKDVDLFGGRLLVRFSTRTVQENRDINEALQSEEGSEFLRKRNRARLVKSLKLLKLKNGKELIPAEDPQEALDAQTDVMYSAILAAFREFEQICDVLFRKANDPDFWTETGGAS